MRKIIKHELKIKIGIMSYHSLISYRHDVKRLSLNLTSKDVLVTSAGEKQTAPLNQTKHLASLSRSHGPHWWFNVATSLHRRHDT